MCIWVHPYTVTPVEDGGIFGKLVWLSWSDVVMSWLRLQTPVKYIPHPCHMYTKCFSTLICCGWAHESTPTLLRLCRSGADFRKIGVWLSPYDVVMLWLRHEVHPTSISYIQSVSAPFKLGIVAVEQQIRLDHRHF